MDCVNLLAMPTKLFFLYFMWETKRECRNGRRGRSCRGLGKELTELAGGAGTGKEQNSPFYFSNHLRGISSCYEIATFLPLHRSALVGMAKLE